MDDNLYTAVSNYLFKWNNFSFESLEVLSQGTSRQSPRYSERHAKGIVQRDKNQRRWSYSVKMSEDYHYPHAGELGAPLDGDFILLPASSSGGINEKSWQRLPGQTNWKKVDATLQTLGSKLEIDYLFHATVLDSTSLRKAQKKGTFPVFGANANKGKNGDLYEISGSKPTGYKYGFWVDPLTKELLQITVAKTEFGENHEVTVGFWNINKSDKPIIVAPTH